MIGIVVFMNPIPNTILHTHTYPETMVDVGDETTCDWNRRMVVFNMNGDGASQPFLQSNILEHVAKWYVLLRKRAARKMESTDGPVPFFEKKGTLEFFL